VSGTGLYILGVLIFAVGLLGSIALHEVGHMLPAKKFGVKVTQYMVGFGPTVWSRRRGDTEYGIKALPFGGYIRMIGMVPPRADGRRSRWPRRMATAIEDFRHVSRAEVRPDDEDRQFYRLTPGKKMIVMLGGPSMNLLIYLVLAVVLLTTLGMPHHEPTTQINNVVKCVVAANSKDANRSTCPTAAQAAPAFNKLRPGDTVIAVDGRRISTWAQLAAAIQPAAGRTLHFTVRRDGRIVPVAVTPVKNTYHPDTGVTKTAGYIGIQPVDRHYFVRQSITQVPGVIGGQISSGVTALGSYPSKIASLWRTVFEGKRRDPTGAVGVVGIGRLSGDFASSTTYDLQDKVYLLIGLLASVNLLLFFFNLLPLLPLDGGHVAGALVESAKRGRARLRSRRNGTRSRPQIFVDTAQMVPIMYVVASVLIVISLLTLYADIVKPISFSGG
jgi:membrane-associated protease RseP (regulator of RpoE activity)